jgi:hypothetical protein
VDGNPQELADDWRARYLGSAARVDPDADESVANLLQLAGRLS